MAKVVKKRTRSSKSSKRKRKSWFGCLKGIGPMTKEDKYDIKDF